MSTLDDWITAAATELDLPPAAIDITLRDSLLDLTKDVAHGITRVAGPLTTYLVGRAVEAGQSPAEAIGKLTTLAAAHSTSEIDAS